MTIGTVLLTTFTSPAVAASQAASVVNGSFDPPSTSALANTNDTNAAGSLGATDPHTSYLAEIKAHKNYSRAPLAPLQLARWFGTYRHTHSGLGIKRNSDLPSACSDINFSTDKKES